MKVFTILATILGVCVAFAAATSQVELPCCPVPPIKFGIGPVCTPCPQIRAPC